MSKIPLKSLCGIFLFLGLLGCRSYPDGVAQKKTLSYRGGQLQAWQDGFRNELFKALELSESEVLLSADQARALSFSVHPIDLSQNPYRGLKAYLQPYASQRIMKQFCAKDPQSLFFKSTSPMIEIYLCDDFNKPIRVWDVRLQSVDGTELSAYVLVPRFQLTPEDESWRTFLYFHGHNSGRDEAGFAYHSYHHALGLEMAKMGYLTLLPQLRTFVPENHKAHSRYVKKNEDEHPPLLSQLVRDGVLWGAFLDSADLTNLGISQNDKRDLSNWVAGTSLGSQVALLVGALDTRYEAVGTFGGFYGFEVLHSQFHHGCQRLPLLTDKANIMDLALLVLPRRLLITMGEGDEFYNGYSKTALADFADSVRKSGLTVCEGRPEAVLKQISQSEACRAAIVTDPKAEHEVVHDAKSLLDTFLPQ